PWHFLSFLPLPHGQGSLRPTPEYGLDAKPGSGLGSGGGLPLDTRPSAAGFDAVIGPCFFGCPPIGPVTDWLGPPRGGPISICSLSHRSAKVVCRSFMRPTNISYAVFCLKKKSSHLSCGRTPVSADRSCE